MMMRRMIRSGNLRKDRRTFGCLLLCGLLLLLVGIMKWNGGGGGTSSSLPPTPPTTTTLWRNRTSGTLIKKAVDEQESEELKGRPFKILFWTKWDGDEVNNSEYFILPQCRDQFLLTSNKLEYGEADVVMFVFNEIHRVYGFQFPPYRKSNVPWILEMNEGSIHRPNNDLRRYDGLFNWTWSYHTDSIILMTPLFTDVFEKAEQPDLRWVYGSLFAKEFLRKKTKVAAWVLSNCNFQRSKRNELAQALEALGVPIDKYGDCGVPCEATGEECFTALGSSHKFYLAFENALCEEYITEKISHGLLHEMVPVVYALGNVARHAPPNSFINVLDFQTVGDLAGWLHYLDRNPEVYFKYFEWRRDYEGDISKTHRYQCHAWRKMKEYTEKLKKSGEGQQGQGSNSSNYRHVYNNLTQWYSQFYNQKLGKLCRACLADKEIDVKHLALINHNMYNHCS